MMNDMAKEGNMKGTSSKRLVPDLRFPEFEQNGEWEEKRLGDLCEIGNGKDYKHLNKGRIPVYGSGGYMTSIDAFLYDGDSVCIGRKGTIDRPIFLTGKFWTVDTLFYTHSFCCCLPKFLYWVFQQIDWYRYNEAGGVPSLSKKTIENIKHFFPSLAEQQKIAECLSSIDEEINAIKEKAEQLKIHKKGLMQKLFPVAGKFVPEIRFLEFRDSKDWKATKISDIFLLTRGNVLSASAVKDVPTQEYKYPVYSSQTLNNGLMGYYNKKLYKDAITWTTDGANAGTVRLRLGYFYCTNVCGVLLNDSGYANKCISEIIGLRTKEYVSHVGNPKLMNKVMGEIPITIPPTLSEQQKIAECLSSIDELISLYENKVILMEQHKKGLMQRLFPKL